MLLSNIYIMRKLYFILKRPFFGFKRIAILLLCKKHQHRTDEPMVSSNSSNKKKIYIIDDEITKDKINMETTINSSSIPTNKEPTVIVIDREKSLDSIEIKEINQDENNEKTKLYPFSPAIKSIAIISILKHRLKRKFYDKPRFQSFLRLSFLWCGISHIFYYMITVPLRIGFYFDPYNGKETSIVVTHHRKLSTQDHSDSFDLILLFDILMDFIGILCMFQLYYNYRQAILREKNRNKKNSITIQSMQSKNQIVSPSMKNIYDPSLNLDNTNTTFVIRAVSGNHSNKDTDLSYLTKKRLFIWFISIIPLELIGLMIHNTNIVHILRLTKLMRMCFLNYFFFSFQQICFHYRWVRTLMRTGIPPLIQKFYEFLFLSHVAGCFYGFLGHWECGLDVSYCSEHAGHGKISWIGDDNLFHATTNRKYWRAMNSDVVPKTNMETIMTIGLMICRVIIISYIIAAFSFLFKNINNFFMVFNTYMQRVHRYMKSRNLPKDLQQKVLAFFEYKWNSQHGLDEKTILEYLPDHFRTRCFTLSKVKKFSEIPIFAKEDPVFINNLALLLDINLYSPRDWVIQWSWIDEMFFISRGKVSIINWDQFTKTEVITQQLTDEGYFAEMALFKDNSFKQKVRAETYCEIYSLSRLSLHLSLSKYYKKKNEITKKLKEMTELTESTIRQREKMFKLLGKKKSSLQVHRKSVIQAFSTAGKKRNPLVLTGNIDSNSSSDHSFLPRLHWTEPNSTFRCIWDVFLLGTLMEIIFEIPYDMAFVPELKLLRLFRQATVKYNGGPLFIALNTVIEIIIFIDFYFRCRKFAYIDLKETGMYTPIRDPTLIFKYYKRHGMYIDGISLLPLLYLFQFFEVSSRLVWMAYIPYLLRIYRVRTLLKTVYKMFNTSVARIFIFNIILGCIVSFHCVCCLWYIASDFSLTYENLVDIDYINEKNLTNRIKFRNCLSDVKDYSNCSWVIRDQSYNQTTTFLYVRSLYWTVITMAGEGFGDIRAFSILESFFSFWWIFIGGYISLGVVGAMSSAISQIKEYTEKHEEHLEQINIFMEMKKVPENVRGMVRRYYSYQWERQHGINENSFLLSLPNRLQEEISEFIHSKSVLRIPLFSQASKDFINVITTKFRQEVYQENDFIVREGDLGDTLYIINRGKIEIGSSHLAFPLLALSSKGTTFGEYAFFNNTHHRFCLISRSFSEISTLSKMDFDLIVKRFPQEKISIENSAKRAIDKFLKLENFIKSNLKKPKVLSMIQGSTTIFIKEKKETAIVSPSSNIYLFWKIPLQIILLYNSIMIVFRVVFWPSPTYDDMIFLTLVDIFCDIFLYIDVYLNYNHFGFFREGEEILVRSQIRKNYIKSDFLLDMFVHFPLWYISWFPGNSYYITLSRLPKILASFRIPKLASATQTRFQQGHSSAKMSSIIGIFKLFFVILLINHYFSCLFYFIGNIENDPRSWIKNDIVVLQSKDSNIHILVLYLRSFYWTLATLSLEMFADIVPKGILETFFSSVIFLLGFFIIAQIIGEFANLIARMDKLAFQYEEEVEVFNHYAKNKNLPRYLTERAHYLFKYHFNRTKGLEFKKLFKDLPPTLRLQLSLELHGAMISRLPMFSSIDTGRLNALIDSLETEYYVPDDDIISEDTIGTRLYIMNNGRAEVWQKTNGIVLAPIYENACFGEISFFLPHIKRMASVRAVTCCEIMILEKYHWDNLWIEDNDNDVKKLKKDIENMVEKRYYYYLNVSTNIEKNLINQSIVKKKRMTYRKNDLNTRKDGKLHRMLLVPNIIDPLEKFYIKKSQNIQALKKTDIVNLHKIHPAILAWNRMENPSLVTDDDRWNDHVEMMKRNSIKTSRISTLRTRASNNLLPLILDSRQTENSIETISSSKDLKKKVVFKESVFEPDRETLKRHRKVLEKMEERRFMIKKEELNKITNSNNKTAELLTNLTSEFSVLKRNNSNTKRRHSMVNNVSINGSQVQPEVIITAPELKRRPSNSDSDVSDKSAINKSSIAFSGPFSNKTNHLKRLRKLEYFHYYRNGLKQQVENDNTRTFSDAYGTITSNIYDNDDIYTRTMYGIWSDQENSRVSVKKQKFNKKDGILVIIILYYSLVIPFRAFFMYDYFSKIQCKNKFLMNFWFFIEYCMDLFCMIDIITLWKNKEIEKDGEIIIDLKLAKQYRMKDLTFITNLMSSIPLDILFIFFSNWDCELNNYYTRSLLRLNKLFRLVHFSTLLKKFQDYLIHELKVPISVGTLSYSRIFLWMSLVAHWIACLWFFLTEICSKLSTNSWITTVGMLNESGKLEDSSIGDRYIRSIFFSFNSILIFASGDIVSQNIYETFIHIIILIISICFFGTLVGANEMSNEREKGERAAFEGRVQNIRQYLEYRKFPDLLRFQISQYFNNLWHQQEGKNEEEALMLLSKSLKQDVTLYVKRELVEQVKLFESCDETFVRALVPILKPETFVPNDTIIEEGNIGRSMYFIATGKVVITSTSNSYEVIKGKGDYFGELSLLNDLPRTATCYSLTSCELYVLEYDKYKELLKEFPEYKELNEKNWGKFSIPNQSK